MSDLLQQQLDELADLRSALSVEAMNKAAAVQAVLTAEQRGKLAEIDAEFDERVAAATEKAEQLETEIKEAVKAAGVTVRGQHLMAVYSQRSTWDNKKLLNYAKESPEVLKFRALTSVISIRTVEQ